MPSSVLPASHCAHSQDRASGVEASRSGRVLGGEKRQGSEPLPTHLATPRPQSPVAARHEALPSRCCPPGTPASDSLGSLPFPLTSHLEQKATLPPPWVLDPF